jgi:hypothetical protein
VRARAQGALSIGLHFLPSSSLGDTGPQLRSIHTDMLRNSTEPGSGIGEFGPCILLSVERIVGWPKLALSARAHRHFRGRHRVRMQTRERQIDEDPPNFSGRYVLALEYGQHGDRKHPTRGTLEIGHFVNGHRRRRRAFGPSRERIFSLPVLRASDDREEQRGGETDASNQNPGQGPDLVQMAMTPHWESDLRNSAGTSPGLR